MRKSTAGIVVAVFFGLLLVTLYLRVAGERRVAVDSGYKVVMGTFAHIVAVAPDRRTAEAGIEAAFRQQQEIERLMSYHRSDSELSRINREAFGRAVKISQATLDVLRTAMEFSKLSAGAFDVTVGPLVDLWRSAGEANVPPTESELLEARAKVGWEKVILDANELTVRFTVKGMKIDLGGIAKGYAIDRSVEAMRKCGVFGGMVDIGGNIRCFGRPAYGKPKWMIAVQDPNVSPDDLSGGKPLLVLELTDEAVATSGHYRRFVTVQGKRHSHIIDPHTGSDSDKLASVTIIAPDAITADALSTAVSVMGAEKGLALIEAHVAAQTEAILITGPPGQKILQTSGAQKYIKRPDVALEP